MAAGPKSARTQLFLRPLNHWFNVWPLMGLDLCECWWAQEYQVEGKILWALMRKCPKTMVSPVMKACWSVTEVSSASSCQHYSVVMVTDVFIYISFFFTFTINCGRKMLFLEQIRPWNWSWFLTQSDSKVLQLYFLHSDHNKNLKSKFFNVIGQNK